jgi:hypothetical protein
MLAELGHELWMGDAAKIRASVGGLNGGIAGKNQSWASLHAGVPSKSSACEHHTAQTGAASVVVVLG